MKRDDGFTLIELLLSVALLLIITVPLTSALLVSLRSWMTEDRLRDSSTEQLAAVYFARDVASAKSAVATAGCMAVTGTVVSLRWSDPGTAADVQRAADWSVESGQLIRTACVLGGPGQRKSLGSAVTAVTCEATPTCFSTSPAPRTLSLRVVQPAPDARTFVLDGTRRSS